MRRRGLIVVGLMAGSLALVACGPSAQPAPGSPAPTAAPAIQSPSAPAPRPSITPPTSASLTSAPASVTGAELRGQFVDSLSTIEDLDRIELEIQRLGGVASVSGDEVSVVIRYDPSRVTPEQLRQVLAELGHPIR